MSGTSLDGVDMALIETDGERIARFGPTGYRPYALAERDILRRALAEAEQKLNAIKEIERSIIERSPSPPGSRDANPSETQSSSTSR